MVGARIRGFGDRLGRLGGGGWAACRASSRTCCSASINAAAFVESTQPSVVHGALSRAVDATTPPASEELFDGDDDGVAQAVGALFGPRVRTTCLGGHIW